MSDKLERKTKKKKIIIFAGAVFITTALILMLYSLWAVYFSIGGELRIVEIPYGISKTNIAALLRKAGVIKSKLFFYVFAGRKGGSLKAGEYEFSPDENLIQVVDKISKGRVKLHSIVIPEGFDRGQIATLVETKGLGNRAKFIEATDAVDVLKRFNIPVSCEGYLFPDTYHLPKNYGEVRMVEMMVNRFFEKNTVKDTTILSKLSLNFNQIITLASLIEHEAKTQEERALVSAVFHNRLKQKRRLESCVTVFFALKRNGVDIKDKKVLTIADTEVVSPYNTYKRKGLPPGPICSPGAESINAALNPAAVDYLYFVSKNDGTHEFAKTYDEFIRYKKKYKVRKKAS